MTSVTCVTTPCSQPHQDNWHYSTELWLHACAGCAIAACHQMEACPVRSPMVYLKRDEPADVICIDLAQLEGFLLALRPYNHLISPHQLCWNVVIGISHLQYPTPRMTHSLHCVSCYTGRGRLWHQHVQVVGVRGRATHLPSLCLKGFHTLPPLEITKKM